MSSTRGSLIEFSKFTKNLFHLPRLEKKGALAVIAINGAALLLSIVLGNILEKKLIQMSLEVGALLIYLVSSFSIFKSRTCCYITFIRNRIRTFRNA